MPLSVSAIPDSPEALAYRCRSYHELGEDDRAIPDCNRAIKLDPELAIAYLYSAKISRDLEEFGACVDYAVKTLSLDPDNRDALMARGLCRMGLKKWREAVNDFSAARGLAMRDPGVLLLRAEALLRLGDLKPAIADAEAAAELDPRLARAWQMLAHLKQQAGDKVGANEAARRALELAPGR